MDLILSNLVTNPTLYEIGMVPRWALRVLDLSTILNDFADISTIVTAWINHLDWYNFGRACGKIVKVFV